MINKYINLISIFLIIVISISIIVYSNLLNEDTECFENKKTLEDRVSILEEKINGIKKTPDNRLSLLENSTPGINNVLENFKKIDDDKYSKMYLWYAKLTGSDPELVKKEEEKKKTNNEQAFKDMETQMKEKYNKK